MEHSNKQALTLRSDVAVQLVQDVGNDKAICQAARVSTLGAASFDKCEAAGLIKFLLRNGHGSPFEHGSMTFLIEAPIFVAREFMRHRAGWSYNEESGRYKELDGVFYCPGVERPLVQVGKAGDYRFEQGTMDQGLAMLHALVDAYRQAWTSYRNMLDAGIARELARTVLPVGTYTSWYATCNPRSLMHFLSLRTQRQHAAQPSKPQYEIELVANQMEHIFRELYPLTYQAYDVDRAAP